jgi:hypothetical protein
MPTDRYDEDKSRLTQFCKRARSRSKNILNVAKLASFKQNAKCQKRNFFLGKKGFSIPLLRPSVMRNSAAVSLYSKLMSFISKNDKGQEYAKE